MCELPQRQVNLGKGKAMREKFAILIMVASVSLSAFGKTPTFKLKYNIKKDAACRNDAGAGPESAWTKELAARVKTIQSLWDKKSRPLFTKLFKVIGRAPKRLAYYPELWTCPGVVSFSNPLRVQARFFLSSYEPGGGANPVKDSKLLAYLEKIKDPTAARFVDLLFHEYTHNYLAEIFGDLIPDTPLTKKYRAELGDSGLMHLHVMAIEQYLERDDRDAANEWNKTFYEMVSYARDPNYMKTWTIVEKETPLAFIKEIQKAVEPPAGSVSAVHL